LQASIKGELYTLLDPPLQLPFYHQFGKNRLIYPIRIFCGPWTIGKLLLTPGDTMVRNPKVWIFPKVFSKWWKNTQLTVLLGG